MADLIPSANGDRLKELVEITTNAMMALNHIARMNLATLQDSLKDCQVVSPSVMPQYSLMPRWAGPVYGSQPSTPCNASIETIDSLNKERPNRSRG